MKEINGPSGGTSERPRPATVQSAHEAAFSLNLSMLVVAAFYVLYPYVPVFERIEQYLEGMDIAISRHLHLLSGSTGRLLQAARAQKDILTGGYFSFFIPVMVLAFCFWFLLRLGRKTRIAREILRSVAGVLALCGAPLWWLWVSYLAGHWWWWSALVKIQLYEIIAVCCLVAYFYAKRPTPTRDSALFLLVHYAFWLWQFRFFLRALMRGWGGSVALLPVIGLFAGLTWIVYASQLPSRISATALGSDPIHS